MSGCWFFEDDANVGTSVTSVGGEAAGKHFLL
jgi:hypothetical protein